MLDELEMESVQLALEPLELGRCLGSGRNTATFLLKDCEDRVVKVFRRFAARDTARGLLSEFEFAARVFARKSVGLLDVLLVERVTPLAERLARKPLSELEEERLMDMFVRLPSECGVVNFRADDLHTLGWTRGGPVILDPASCIKTDVRTEEEKLRAAALHCGLFCQGQGLGPDSRLFQFFASVATKGRPPAHAGEKLGRSDLRGLRIDPEADRIEMGISLVARALASGPAPAGPPRGSV